jgi:hypothetical protein
VAIQNTNLLSLSSMMWYHIVHLRVFKLQVPLKYWYLSTKYLVSPQMMLILITVRISDVTWIYLFYGFLNDAVNSSNYIAMNDQIIMIWKGHEMKWSLSNLRLLTWHLPGGTEENHEKYKSGHQVCWPRVKVGTAQI